MDGGANWQPPARVSGCDDATSCEFPSVSAATAGSISVTFYARPVGSSGAGTRVELTYSSDGGRSFASPAAVSVGFTVGAPGQSGDGATAESRTATGYEKNGDALAVWAQPAFDTAGRPVGAIVIARARPPREHSTST